MVHLSDFHHYDRHAHLSPPNMPPVRRCPAHSQPLPRWRTKGPSLWWLAGAWCSSTGAVGLGALTAPPRAGHANAPQALEACLASQDFPQAPLPARYSGGRSWFPGAASRNISPAPQGLVAGWHIAINDGSLRSLQQIVSSFTSSHQCIEGGFF